MTYNNRKISSAQLEEFFSSHYETTEADSTCCHIGFTFHFTKVEQDLENYAKTFVSKYS